MKNNNFCISRTYVDSRELYIRNIYITDLLPKEKVDYAKEIVLIFCGTRDASEKEILKQKAAQIRGSKKIRFVVDGFETPVWKLKKTSLPFLRIQGVRTYKERQENVLSISCGHI